MQIYGHHIYSIKNLHGQQKYSSRFILQSHNKTHNMESTYEDIRQTIPQKYIEALKDFLIILMCELMFVCDNAIKRCTTKNKIFLS